MCHFLNESFIRTMIFFDRNTYRCVLVWLVIFWSCCVLTCNASSQYLTNQWVKKMASPLIENRIADGISIGYIEGHHYGTVHLGSSNQEGNRASNLTLYEIGSVSKVFTSLLLANAVVRGEIDLNSIAEIANQQNIQFPTRNDKTIKWGHLSTHRSGLPRLPTNMHLTDLTNPYRDYDSRKAATFLNGYELPRDPGEAYEYSNFAASVLGYLVSQHAGMSYEELLQVRIAKPLRMNDCTISLTTDQSQRLATPHNKFGSTTSPWTFADLPGAGGIRTTLFDLMRFAKAQLFPPAGYAGKAIELAWKKHQEADASGPAMGLGWLIHADGQTRWHNGQTGGYHSVIFINREIECAVIVLCNTAVSDNIDQLAMQMIARVALQGAEPSSDESSEKKPGELAIDAKLRKRLEGRYQLTPNFIFDVNDRDGHLMVGITNQPTQEVFPDSATMWSYRGVDAKLEFQLRKSGRAKSLILHQNGIKQVARRIR